jgi:hypothetical protein
LSSSDRIAGIADELAALASGVVEHDGEEPTVSDGDLAKLLRSAVAIFSRLTVDPSDPETEATLRSGVTVTEACAAIAALLRSQELTPFEFTVWYSASGGTRESI